MNTEETYQQHEESTYSLLARSEEKRRAGLEVFVYFLLLITALTAIVEFLR